MEVKKQLSKEELQQLDQQYYEISDGTKNYHRQLWTITYYRRFNRKQRKEFKKQDRFFRVVMNETLITLMFCNALSTKTAIDALENRFVKIKTKIKVCEYLRYKEKQRYHGVER